MRRRLLALMVAVRRLHKRLLLAVLQEYSKLAQLRMP
jgi:hypothetical protein